MGRHQGGSFILTSCVTREKGESVLRDNARFFGGGVE